MHGRLWGVVVSLRPYQWTKNLAVFAALGFSKHLFETPYLLRSLLAFGLFCGLSGVVYFLNDIADREGDRRHPLKCRRPIACGELPVGLALAAAAVIAAAGLMAAFWLAHRRWLPLGWLLTLLAANLVMTLAVGGLILQTLNVISVGFAAILLGLAVDYGLVLYQEAAACPGADVRSIRRAVGPSIWWAAVTTAGDLEDAFNQFVWVQRACVTCHGMAREKGFLPARKPPEQDPSSASPADSESPNRSSATIPSR